MICKLFKLFSPWIKVDSQHRILYQYHPITGTVLAWAAIRSQHIGVRMYKYLVKYVVTLFYLLYCLSVQNFRTNIRLRKYTPMASEVRTKWSWAGQGCWSRVKWAGKLLELRELTRYSNVLAAASEGAPLHWDCSGNLPVISRISDSIHIQSPRLHRAECTSMFMSMMMTGVFPTEIICTSEWWRFYENELSKLRIMNMHNIPFSGGRGAAFSPSAENKKFA